jgi:hypothetical protein
MSQNLVKKDISGWTRSYSKYYWAPLDYHVKNNDMFLFDSSAPDEGSRIVLRVDDEPVVGWVTLWSLVVGKDCSPSDFKGRKGAWVYDSKFPHSDDQTYYLGHRFKHVSEQEGA